MPDTIVTEEGPIQLAEPRIGPPVGSEPPAKIKAPTAALGAGAVGALALGAVAIGALAIGRLVIGRMAVDRLAVGKASAGRIRLHHLEIDELIVRHLRAPDAPPAKRPVRDHAINHLPRLPKGWRWRRR
jgi:hypothetical protein